MQDCRNCAGLVQDPCECVSVCESLSPSCQVVSSAPHFTPNFPQGLRPQRRHVFTDWTPFCGWCRGGRRHGEVLLGGLIRKDGTLVNAAGCGKVLCYSWLLKMRYYSYLTEYARTWPCLVLRSPFHCRPSAVTLPSTAVPAGPAIPIGVLRSGAATKRPCFANLGFAHHQRKLSTARVCHREDIIRQAECAGSKER